MILKREISDLVLNSAKKMPVITVSGPRQSGKTTLVKTLFDDYKYFNMELPLTRERFVADPISFFDTHNRGIILDEFQNIPEILSYVQVLSDKNPNPGKFILTGSQNFIMLEKISQSLAGRTALFNLLPFSLSELSGTDFELQDSDDYIIKGFYPRIYDAHLNPTEWLIDYINLYLERDVRQMINIHDAAAFSLFIKLCAGRIGQLLNISTIADIVGRDAKTIRTWLSALEAGFIVYLLKPYYRNFNKRVTKSPKLYFYDVGLACALLGINSKFALDTHYLKGQLFENLVIAELLKNNYNKRKDLGLYFWNVQGNNEIDCLIESAGKLTAIEIKASKSFSPGFTKNINKFSELTGADFSNGYVVMDGDEEFEISGVNVINWKEINKIIKEMKT